MLLLFFRHKFRVQFKLYRKQRSNITFKADSFKSPLKTQKTLEKSRVFVSCSLVGQDLWRHHPESNWGIKVLQTSALPLGYGAIWSGKRGSNPPPLPWQGSALPNELFPQYGASEWSRTTDTGIFSPLLYQLSYRGIGDPEGARTPDLQRDRLAF